MANCLRNKKDSKIDSEKSDSENVEIVNLRDIFKDYAHEDTIVGSSAPKDRFKRSCIENTKELDSTVDAILQAEPKASGTNSRCPPITPEDSPQPESHGKNSQELTNVDDLKTALDRISKLRTVDVLKSTNFQAVLRILLQVGNVCVKWSGNAHKASLIRYLGYSEIQEDGDKTLMKVAMEEICTHKTEGISALKEAVEELWEKKSLSEEKLSNLHLFLRLAGFFYDRKAVDDLIDMIKDVPKGAASTGTETDMLAIMMFLQVTGEYFAHLRPATLKIDQDIPDTVLIDMRHKLSHLSYLQLKDVKENFQQTNEVLKIEKFGKDVERLRISLEKIQQQYNEYTKMSKENPEELWSKLKALPDVHPWRGLEGLKELLRKSAPSSHEETYWSSIATKADKDKVRTIRIRKILYIVNLLRTMYGIETDFALEINKKELCTKLKKKSQIMVNILNSLSDRPKEEELRESQERFSRFMELLEVTQTKTEILSLLREAEEEGNKFKRTLTEGNACQPEHHDLCVLNEKIKMSSDKGIRLKAKETLENDPRWMEGKWVTKLVKDQLTNDRTRFLAGMFLVATIADMLKEISKKYPELRQRLNNVLNHVRNDLFHRNPFDIDLFRSNPSLDTEIDKVPPKGNLEVGCITGDRNGELAKEISIVSVIGQFILTSLEQSSTKHEL